MSAPAATAALIEDRGEAAAATEFFRSRPFLDAESVTHTLRIRSGAAELLAPLVVREIPPPMGRSVEAEATNRPIDPEFDGVSPYGYPGLSAPDGFVADPGAIDFGPTGLVSLFIRHRLGVPALGGSTERNVVQIADPALPPKSRPSDRRQVRKNLEAGYELALVPGSETTPTQRAGFLAVYEQTMRRAGAAGHYFFPAAYFDRVLEAGRTWLVLATAPGGELAAASIAVVSDGYLHYYLSGSADSHLRDSPMKNIVTGLIEHSAELSLPLNLGGGISANDALEEFKRGFGNRQETWRTSEIVCDRAAYERLAAGRDAGGYFPAYRASRS
ncbi:MAG: GNAT family N-acetyltransferase [Solirubrobacterales bacterium]